MSARLHNLIFAALIGAILGVTAYVLHVSETPANDAPAERRNVMPSNMTERMIERGELSNREAKYYRVIAHE